MKKIIILLVAVFVLSFSTFAYSQGVGRITQEEFAVELIKTMRMDGWLPTAALPSDCVDLLERLGVAPLSGWDNKALLNQEDYLVILAQINGKEKLVHARAAAVEQRTIDVINKKWQQARDKTGRWIPLKEFLNDTSYFQGGSPRSPYGLKYEDKDGDHAVDPHFLPVKGLMNLRSYLTSEDF